jgi:predicted DNA-binding protein
MRSAGCRTADGGEVQKKIGVVWTGRGRPFDGFYTWSVVTRCTPHRRSSAWQDCRALGYDLVILDVVKTAISVPDETFDRVERAAAQLGVSRSEFFARAAERWLHDLDDPQTTDAIDRALAGIVQDTAFTDAAAAAVAKREART